MAVARQKCSCRRVCTVHENYASGSWSECVAIWLAGKFINSLVTEVWWQPNATPWSIFPLMFIYPRINEWVSVCVCVDSFTSDKEAPQPEECYVMRLMLCISVACAVVRKHFSPVHCLSVSLSASKITQRVHGFGWNVACRHMSGHGRTY